MKKIDKKNYIDYAIHNISLKDIKNANLKESKQKI